MNHNFLITFILTTGLVFRLLLTANGNFIFHMDSARDMVDVREMVELKKPRLTGPTSAIEGFYNGPAWYYLLAIPYLLTDGDPYGSILMEIALWLIGGYFLIRLVERWGTLPTVTAGVLWISSNYITLLTSYAFNPNPVPLLTPVLIYLLERYLATKKLMYSLFFWFLGGLFFNFEMNVGVLVPVIFLVALYLSNNLQLLKSPSSWIGSVGYLVCLLPQIAFDLKHQFIMSNSILRYLADSPSQITYNPLTRFGLMLKTFYQGLTPTFFNSQILTTSLISSVLWLGAKSLRKRLPADPDLIGVDLLLIISVCLVLTSLIGYTLLPVTVNPWHLGMITVSGIILSSWVISKIYPPISAVLALSILIFSIGNVYQFLTRDYGQPSSDPSNFTNELKAIDKVYQLANGINFKVYTHIPSVYDYPYQYLIWWHGNQRYSYLPTEYTYLPDKPPYIPSQNQFQNTNLQIPGSNKIFLIINPQDQRLAELWYNHLSHLPLVTSYQVGPLIVEERKGT